MVGYIENGLRSVDADLVTSVVLVLIALVLFLAIRFTKQNKCRDFVSYAPTLLTTLGIFGTFLGVVIGLLNFDQTDIEGSVPMLLAGLKTAFITSTAGMLASLVFKTLLTTPWLKNSKQEAEVTHATPEAILDAMNSQISEVAKLREALAGEEESSISGQLKILRSDINDNAKLSLKQSEERFKQQDAAFEHFSDKLWIKLQDFADTLSKSATEQVIEALKQVIVDFNNKLTEQFGENFKKLNEAVHKLVEWQEKYKVQIEQMNAQYEQGVKAITTTEASLTTISEKSQVIPVVMSDLSKVMEVNQHQLSELESHLKAFEEMKDKAVEAVPQIRKQVEETVTDIAAAVTAASSHYEKLLSDSSSFVDKHISASEDLLDKFVNETTKGIDAVGTKLVDSSEAIGKTIDTAASEFTDNAARTNESLQSSSDYVSSQTDIIKQHLKDTVDDLNATVRDMVEKLIVDANAMNKTLESANQTLAADTEKVRDTFVSSATSLQTQLRDVIEQTATQNTDFARRTFESLEQQAMQQVNRTSEVVESQVQLLEQELQREINQAFNQMGSELAQITEKFTTDYSRLTNQMKSVIQQAEAF